MLSYSITPQDHCRRLESFVRTLMPTAPSGYGRKLIKSGALKVNGASATPDTLLCCGTTVTLKESSATCAYCAAPRPEMDILFEDSNLLIVNKPAGLAMHCTAECDDNLVELGQHFMTQRDTPCKLYPVNRLDRGTSGAVILAKSSRAAAVYGRQVKESGLNKRYLAVVWGTPDSSGVISEPLDEKESETRYRIVLGGDNCSLLAVTPISGRMHQIRRHLALIGRPVMGDSRYGGGEVTDLPGFALHSFRTALSLAEGGTLTVCAPLPDSLRQLCLRRGIHPDELNSTLLHLAGQEVL